MLFHHRAVEARLTNFGCLAWIRTKTEGQNPACCVLFPLAADTAPLFFFRGGHADHGEGLVIAGEIPVQAADQLPSAS